MYGQPRKTCKSDSPAELHIDHKPESPRPRCHRATMHIGWKKSDIGWMKLNTDGASKGNPSGSGVGVCVGILMEDGYMASYRTITTSISAELWAVKTGLEMAWDLGFRRISLEVDLETVVRLLRSSNVQACSNGALLRDIRSLLQRDWLVVVEHTFREGNFCTDWLENYALICPIGVHRLSSCPPRLHFLLFGDDVGPPCPAFIMFDLFSQ
ncbi:hypothetical protein CRG98_023660 [Punica granatum]|uniref:RNase H type-1 domain-containing protein n=1 Tax=Punica granatum TaxID=22663 RepID=A0A2I0JI41_PUNGR|nr:hypothetical protein CRG98_023660 [Punica granatum]